MAMSGGISMDDTGALPWDTRYVILKEIYLGLFA
jgi:hypothetical protein